MQCFCFQEAEPIRGRICKYPGETPIPKRVSKLAGETVALYLAHVSINTDSICCMRQAIVEGFDIYDTIPNDDICKYGFVVAALHAQSYNVIKYLFNIIHYDIGKFRITEDMSVTPTEILHIYLFINITFGASEIKDMFYFFRNHGIICNSPNIMFPILTKILDLITILPILKTSVYTTDYLMDICPKLDDETYLHRAVLIGDVALVKKILASG